MTSSAEDTNKAVADYLASIGVTYSVVGNTLAGTRPSKDDEGWEHDPWIYTFERNGKRIEDRYKTGIGHRRLTKMGKVAIRNAGNMGSVYRSRLEREHSAPVPPPAAGVMHSLMLDSRSAEQNFHDWCSDLGSDPDSIKALNIYNACCELLQKVRGFFTSAERQHLEKLLEDY